MRILRVAAVISGLFILAVAGLLGLANTDWTRGYVERKATESTGRDVSIGELRVTLGWKPVITFEDIRMANPSWAQTKYLVDARELRLTLLIPPLFRGHIVFDDVVASRAEAGLERDGDRTTWSLSRDQKDGSSRVQVRRIFIDEGRVRFRDAGSRTDLEISVTGATGEGGELRARASGRFRGLDATAVAQAPAFVPGPDTPMHLSAAAVVGAVTMAAAGTVRGLDNDGIDIHLELAGDDLSEFHGILGINLPSTPPFRLAGRLRNPRGSWTLAPFEGHVGDSDLAGNFSFERTGTRPLIRATLQSNLLDLDDLGPVIGTPQGTGPGETAGRRQRAEAKRARESERVLPSKRLEVEHWPEMDADVRLTAAKIQRPRALPLERLSTHLTMRDSVLQLQPLDFAVAGGLVRANITVDGRKSPLSGEVALNASNLDLGKLFPAAKRMEKSIGRMYGRADLKGHGRSFAEILGSADGRFSFLINGGTISNLLMEAAGLDAAEALRILATRDPQVELRCAVADFSVKQGVGTAEALVLDTTDTNVTASGTIDFRHETLDLLAVPEPKDPSPFVIRSPLVISGSFKNPSVRPQAGPIALRGAAAALLALVNPLLALIPFIETGPGKDSDCGKLAAVAQSRGKSGAPGSAGTAGRATGQKERGGN